MIIFIFGFISFYFWLFLEGRKFLRVVIFVLLRCVVSRVELEIFKRKVYILKFLMSLVWMMIIIGIRF